MGSSGNLKMSAIAVFVLMLLTFSATQVKSSNDEIKGIVHKNLSINGLNMHVAEMGSGPIILLIHGFPECGYTWRLQMKFFASNNYRAIAPDLRGYAETTGAPLNDPSKFTTIYVVADLVALIEALAPADDGKVFVVGHDWGSVIAGSLALYRPDKVKALVGLSVLFSPRNPAKKPIERLRATYGDDYYIVRFQKAGEIEKEIAEIGTKNVLQYLLTYRNPSPLILRKNNWGKQNTTALPLWLSQQDLDFYVSKYEASGFTGALDYYRALDINWEVTANWTGAQIQVPVTFMVGDLDITYNAPGARDYIENGGFKKYVPLLKDVVVMKNVGHFLHQEMPDQVNAHILSFITNYSSSSNHSAP